MDIAKIEQQLHSSGCGSVLEYGRMHGGSIGESCWIKTTCGERYFVKYLASAPATMFSAEAAGLRAIAATNTIKVPAVLGHDNNLLILEFIDCGPPTDSYWEHLGQGLAAMHAQPQTAFGFEQDNYCGATPQPNPRTTDGHQFFAESRLMHQGKLATDHGLLDTGSMALLERICVQLKALIPEQPPCLLHGDLWSGNHLPGTDGQPRLIDPACYWGWAEADLAMTRLFGGFPAKFYQSYHARLPPLAGWEERFELYNLYHLLNHLNLFGTSYLPQVISVLRKYA